MIQPDAFLPAVSSTLEHYQPGFFEMLFQEGWILPVGACFALGWYFGNLIQNRQKPPEKTDKNPIGNHGGI